MSKQLTLSAAALAVAALIGAAGSAQALPVSAYNSTAGDTLDLYVSGATAQENGLRRAVARMCAVGSLDIYRFANQEAQFCTINTSVVTGVPASITKMVIYKSGVGGSGNGIGPVADATSLTFISMAALKANPALVIGPSTSVPAVAPNAPDTIGIPAYTITGVSTSGSTASFVTEVGLSDVEPALLGASTAQISRLQVTAPNVLLFGVPVTRVARDALQAAQGLTVGSETEANMPSLRLDLIRSIYTGNLFNWGQLGVSNANWGAAGVAAPDDLIYFATRVETSGTQRTFNVNITGAACTAGLQAVQLANAVAADCTAAVPNGNIFAGSGSGDVTTCMAGHNTRQRGAFGVLSMEFVPGAAGAGDGYRYLKVDGFAPTLVNTVNGNYQHWVETSYQYRKSPSPSPLTGTKKTVADRIVIQLGTEAVISSLNNSFAQPFGASGLLAKPSAANPPVAVVPPATAAQVAANPTNAFTRSPTGSPINCQPPVLFN
jgi:hypothetical protein